MRITWYGTAALLLETGDTVLAFDPFEGIPLKVMHPEKGPFPHQEELQKAGHVFVTHGHFDHILEIPALYRDGKGTIHATKTPARTLLRKGIPAERLDTLRPGERTMLGKTAVRSFRGKHCRFDAKLLFRTLFRKRTAANPGKLIRLLSWHTAYPEKGEILCYEVSYGKRRVMILGSLGLDAKTAYPTGADALILPFQGKSDLADAAVPILKKLKPKSVLLDHYDDSFPPMSSEIETKAFCDMTAKEFGIPCRALQKGKTYLIGYEGEML